MKLISTLLVGITVLLSYQNSSAQIKNEIIQTIKVDGNCGICKKVIENAGEEKNVARVSWDANTKEATIHYDSEKTNSEVILKRIALAGYDNEQFLAPNDVYDQLHTCCQYDRTQKPVTNIGNFEASISDAGHSQHSKIPSQNMEVELYQYDSQLTALFDSYFAIKDGLVKMDGVQSAANAGVLLSSINKVKMGNLSTEEHAIWMQVVKNLTANTSKISSTKDVEKQRISFLSLSKDMYELTKIYKGKTTLYYQHCPMYDDGKGGNWLSKEQHIKNPYYGSKMLTCGSVKETINKK